MLIEHFVPIESMLIEHCAPTESMLIEHCVPIVLRLLSTPTGVDYVVIAFDMEVQPLFTHNAA